jgi:protein ImuB
MSLATPPAPGMIRSPHRRVLSLWFPRLAAERLLRQARGTIERPFAVVQDSGNMQSLSALSVEASQAGLHAGQPLRDARAMCPELVTRLANPQAEAAFLVTLRRWAAKFSPWVADAPPASLMIDITGCAHLFGGEAGLLEQVEQDCEALRLSVRAGIADTVGAAWALARFGTHAHNSTSGNARSGDAIDQEARATRSRAVKRRNRERGGAATPHAGNGNRTDKNRIAPPGHTRATLEQMPIAALRLPEATLSQLTRLGLRQIGDLAGQPRAALARRFGKELMLRLDQALGTVPEPISPARPPLHFATRLTLPEPIGLTKDLAAGIDRLLPPLCARLRDKGQGARRVRLQIFRCDQTMQTVEVGLARPSDTPERLLPLLMMKLDDIDAGPGIDVLRLEAHVTEPLHAKQHKGHLNAAADTAERLAGDTAIDDLIGKLGARVTLDTITRLHPASSHLPEKTALVLAAAWSDAATDWPAHVLYQRPLTLFRPELVTPVTQCQPPLQRAPERVPEHFRWRRRTLRITHATGPERIAPEWWLDDADWRTGIRDYWRVETETGERLWLYHAHGGVLSAGWFCHGIFA